MRAGREVRGSITVFTALSVLLVFSVLFSMLELSRVYGLKDNVRVCTAQANDGTMASYDRDLWETYHLLFYKETADDLPELNQMIGEQKELIEGNWSDPLLPIRNYYMIQVHLEDVEVTGYELATDHGGAAFRKEAAQIMAESAGETILKTLLQQSQQNEVETSASAEENALLALEQLESGSAAKEDTTAEQEQPAGETVSAEQLPATVEVTPGVQVTRMNNPLRWVKKLQRKGVLGIVMPDAQISDKSFSIQDAPDRRVLEAGTMAQGEHLSPTEEMLFRMYLTTYYKNALDQRNDGNMAYEMEYIVAGKASDQANLKAVVNRLLLMREAANLAYLETDMAKQEEAMAVATALCTLLCVPELEEVARQGIMAAWAYGESLCDVKILMDGGKVNPVKTTEQWHTQLMDMGAALSTVKGADQTSGLSYENYVSLMMWAMGDRKLSDRALHVIEKNLDTRMDLMLCRMEGTYSYHAQPLFWNFVTIGSGSMDTYVWKTQGSFSYIHDT